MSKTGPVLVLGTLGLIGLLGGVGFLSKGRAFPNVGSCAVVPLVDDRVTVLGYGSATSVFVRSRITGFEYNVDISELEPC